MGGEGSVACKLFIKIKSYKYVTAFSIWTRFSCLWTWTAIPNIAEGNSQIPWLGKSEQHPRSWKFLGQKGCTSKQERAGIRFLSEEEHAWCNLPLWVAEINTAVSTDTLQTVRPFFKVTLGRFQCVWQTETDFCILITQLTFSSVSDWDAFQFQWYWEDKPAFEQTRLALFPISWLCGIKFNYQHFHCWREMSSNSQKWSFWKHHAGSNYHHVGSSRPLFSYSAP